LICQLAAALDRVRGRAAAGLVPLWPAARSPAARRPHFSMNIPGAGWPVVAHALAQIKSPECPVEKDAVT
jgi:hypothetical protein